MRYGLLLAAFLTATGVSMTSASLAHADASPQDIAQARDLGGQAQAAFDAGNFAESEKLWISAGNLFNAPTLTLGLARTQVKLGKLVVARESYSRMLREHGDAPNLSPAFKDALEAAKTEGAAVSARIANVVIIVDGAPNPQVTIDGQAVPAAALGSKRPLDPGSHVVRAEAPGFKPAETRFDLVDGGMAETKLKLEKVEVAAPVAAVESKGPQGASKGSNKTLAIVAFGVGGAGLAVGAITGILALGKHSKLNDQCPDGKCDTDRKSEVDSYKSMGMISTVGFIVAGVGGAAGAVLLLTSPSESAAAPAPSAKLTWHPYVGLGGGGVSGSF